MKIGRIEIKYKKKKSYKQKVADIFNELLAEIEMNKCECKIFKKVLDLKDGHESALYKWIKVIETKQTNNTRWLIEKMDKGHEDNKAFEIATKMEIAKIQETLKTMTKVLDQITKK